MSCDAKTVRRPSWGLGMDTSDRYFDQEYFETNQKSPRLPVQSYGSNSGLHDCCDLDL